MGIVFALQFTHRPHFNAAITCQWKLAGQSLVIAGHGIQQILFLHYAGLGTFIRLSNSHELHVQGLFW